MGIADLEGVAIQLLSCALFVVLCVVFLLLSSLCSNVYSIPLIISSLITIC